MHKRWFFCTALTCIACIALSCLWMITPQTIAPTMPVSTAQSADYYKLVDDGGFVSVIHMVEQVEESATKTEIYVNLLPEADALRIKQGYCVGDAQSLERLLLDLEYALRNEIA